jgi:hypothetical protein
MYKKELESMVNNFDYYLSKIREDKKKRDGERYYLELMTIHFNWKNLKESLSILRLIVWILTISASGILTYIKSIPIIFPIISILLIWYLSLIPYFFSKMCDMDSELFHFDAFKKYKTSVYNLFKEFLDDGDKFVIQDIKEYHEKAEDEWRNKENILKGSLIKLQEENKKSLDEMNSEIKSIGNEVYILESVIEEYHNSIYKLVDEHKWNDSDLDLYNGFVIYKRSGQFLEMENQHKPKWQPEERVDILSPGQLTSPYVQIITHNNFFKVLDDGLIIRFDEDPMWIIRFSLVPKKLDQLKIAEEYGTISLDKIYDLLSVCYQLVQAEKESGDGYVSAENK